MSTHVRYITFDEEKSLRRLAGSADEVTGTRASIVLMSADGIHASDIASALGVCERTVCNAVSVFTGGGVQAVTRKTSPGRPRFLSDEQVGALADLLDVSPADCGYKKKHWTVPLLLEDAQSRGIVADLSCDTLARDLKRAGIDLRAMGSSGATNNGDQKSSHPEGRGAPAGNTSAVRTGAYTNALLSEADRAEYDRVIGRLQGMFLADRATDRVHLETLATYWVRLMRALAAGNIDATERLDRLIRRHLKTLRAARMNEADDQPGVLNSLQPSGRRI